MTRTPKLYALLLLLSTAGGVGVWALLHFTEPRWNKTAESGPVNIRSVDELWAEGVEKVKADRGDTGKNVVFAIPPELQHYEERRWFLATQIAEVHRRNLQSCQDYLELAAMIQRGEIVSVPAATEDYILFGVGAKADDGPFNRYENDQNVPLYDEAQLRDEYTRLETARVQLQNEINALPKSATKGRKRSESQKELAARLQELTSLTEEKALLDQSYEQAENRQRLFGEYESLQTLARNFGGRSYDLENQSERQALKISMLRSMRPEARKVMEEIALDYRQEFDRPLPVSSLVRPEQYQHVLRRFNRAATMIDTPPHSTGLAFDIDYRYMSPAEQMFLMTSLARLKNQGRIEVLRERNANYHVFVFLDGTRPADELITASLEEVGPPAEEANHATTAPAKVRNKSTKEKKKTARTRTRKRR
ncbi:MAG TPA: DUF5715 family protein [Pyrinomonadaceae bacterium]|nr:DUF5715 family protein [Pyrinomonadaceae bacterium]